MDPLLQPTPDAAVCEHLVQVYRDREELAESVAVFLASGFERGEPAVVIATADNWPLFAERIGGRGADVEELVAAGLLQVADADETLAAILVGGVPSLRPFTTTVGALLDRAAQVAPGRRVRAFGEMVEILSARGDARGADALESLWNQLGARRDFTLLCGYKIDVFDRAAQVDLLPQLCRSHSQVLPVSDPQRMERAVDAALVEILGPADAEKVYGNVASHARSGHVPRPQLALMWVSAHMPRSADRILAVAREHYGDGAVAA